MDEVVIKEEKTDIDYKEFIEIEIDNVAILDPQSKICNGQNTPQQLDIEFQPVDGTGKFLPFNGQRTWKSSDFLNINIGLDVKRELKDEEERSDFVNNSTTSTKLNCDTAVGSILAKYLQCGNAEVKNTGNLLHDQPTASSANKNKTRFKCGHCLKTYPDKSEMLKHLKMYKGECKTVSAITDAKASKDSTYRCDMCFATFNKVDNLNDHKLIHSNLLYKCHRCSRICEDRVNLRIHLMNCGDRDYKCNICPKEFNRKDHLRLHLVTHTGEKAYDCFRCCKKFTQSSSLKRHQARFHNVDSGILKCNICSLHFKHKASLKSHLKKSHGC